MTEKSIHQPPQPASPGRRKALIGLAAATATAIGLGYMESKDYPLDQEKDPLRNADIQIFQDKITSLINPDIDPEAFAKIFSDQFLNQPIPGTPENPNPQRFQVSRGKTKVYINPFNQSQSADGEAVSYSVITSPLETNSQRQGVPAIRYGQDLYQNKVVFEGIGGIVTPDNKFSSQLTSGEDPPNDEQAAYEAEDLKKRLQQIIKLESDQWHQFEWDIISTRMGNAGGVPQFGVEGFMIENGKAYTLKLFKSGAWSLTIDHRPQNFNFPEEYYK